MCCELYVCEFVLLWDLLFLVLLVALLCFGFIFMRLTFVMGCVMTLVLIGF